MNTVTQVYKHPVAIFYNRDGSLAFIRFMCFKCAFLEGTHFDPLVFSSLHGRIPLVTLPDITNPSLFFYRDVPAENLYTYPRGCYSIMYEGDDVFALGGVSCISRLYTDGEVISQAFQVLGCTEIAKIGKKPMEEYKYRFRSEYARPGEPRLLIFDHTLNRRYISLKALMQLEGRINVGNMDFEYASLGGGEDFTCPLFFKKDVVSIEAKDSLGLLGASLQKKTNTQEVELRIDNSFVDEFLVVPETVERLILAQTGQVGNIKGITCPSSMTRCSVQAPDLREFVAPKVCANFVFKTYQFSVPEAIFDYTEQTFPEVLKPMGSESQAR